MVDRRFLLKSAAGGLVVGMTGAAARAQIAGPRVRRSVNLLPPDDPWFEDYATAVTLMRQLPKTDGRSWYRQAEIHLNHCVHGRNRDGIEFTIWHRHYLSYFESICAELIGKPDFSLCYWDWSADEGRIPAQFYDDARLNPEILNDRPVSPPTTGRRRLGKGQGLHADSQLFSPSSIEKMQRLPNFALYIGKLEGSPHNTAHGLVGGHMGAFMSPLDPIFWLHHCNVDRLWAEWTAAGHANPNFSGVYTNHFVDAAGASVSVAAADTSKLNYIYELPSATGIVVPTLGVAAPVGADGMNIVSLSRQVVNAKAFVDTETRLPLQASGLIDKMFSPRIFSDLSLEGKPKAGIEGQRVLAILSNVRRRQPSGDLSVLAFINCPYLSPETPITDVHFADEFAFFGPGEMPGHEGHDMGETFVLDLSDALRKLAEEGNLELDLDSIDLQLMPRSSEGDQTNMPEGDLTVGTIEIVVV